MVANMRFLTLQLLCLGAVVTLAASSLAGEQQVAAQRPQAAVSDNLTGWLLVSAPRMRDPRFSRSFIFLAHHGDEGAFGLIVNRRIAVQSATKLLGDILGEGAPDGAAGDDREIQILHGGPVEQTQWIVACSTTQYKRWLGSTRPQ